MEMEKEIIQSLLEVLTLGISTGFASAFTCWGFGFAIYSVIKFFKMAT